MGLLSLPCQGLPVLLFHPSFLCFPGPDALFSTAGCGEDNGAAKGMGSPWPCWIFCHGLNFPSSIKPGIVLTTQEVSPGR